MNTANVMGWKTFQEFHDCHLHTDVLALADVIRATGTGSTPHVTLPGTAWNAMLRHSARHPFTSRFNAMYSAAMTLPMPNGPCVAVALPKERDEAELGVDAEEVSYLLLVDCNSGAARPLGLGFPRA